MGNPGPRVRGAGPRPRVTLPAWAGNLLLLGMSALVGLGVLEVGARVIIARRPIITSGEQGVYSQLDPVLGWRNRPGTSVRYSRRDYQTNVVINSLGFRDVEHPKAKAPGTTRVLVIGDSFIEAYTVELEESVTRRAESIGRAQGCPVEVVNAGVHGYSTDQEALWFLNEGAALGPDVVVVFAYYNDIIHNIRERYWGSPKPLTAVIDGRIVTTNLPLPLPSQPGEPAGLREKPRALIQGSALRSLVLERLVVGAPRFYNRLATLGLWDAWEPEALPDELRAYKASGRVPDFAEAWDRTRAILTALAEGIRRVGAVPVLVHIPAQFEISARDWDLTTMRYGIDPRAWDRTLVRQRLQESADAGGWAFLDLTPALQAAPSVLGREPYLPYDGHWNARGHDAAARAVVAHLRNQNLLPCGVEDAKQGALERKP